MDEISVFRRFFVTTGMIKELLSSVGGMGAEDATPSFETPSHLGGGNRTPIQGRRRATRRQPPSHKPNTDGYSFPE